MIITFSPIAVAIFACFKRSDDVKSSLNTGTHSKQNSSLGWVMFFDLIEVPYHIQGMQKKGLETTDDFFNP